MNVWSAIRDKHAIRNFRDEALPDTAIHQILDAGRRTQSGFNSQPWRFIVVTERDKLERLSKIGRSTYHVAGAAMAVLILCPHPDEQFWRNMFDMGQAASYLQLAAHELGIGSCPGTVYEPDLAREILGFPDSWDSKIIISFGYPDLEKHPPQAPKTGGRQPYDEIVHLNSWKD